MLKKAFKNVSVQTCLLFKLFSGFQEWLYLNLFIYEMHSFKLKGRGDGENNFLKFWLFNMKYLIFVKYSDSQKFKIRIVQKKLWSILIRNKHLRKIWKTKRFQIKYFLYCRTQQIKTYKHRFLHKPNKKNVIWLNLVWGHI